MFLARERRLCLACGTMFARLSRGRAIRVCLAHAIYALAWVALAIGAIVGLHERGRMPTSIVLLAAMCSGSTLFFGRRSLSRHAALPVTHDGACPTCKGTETDRVVIDLDHAVIWFIRAGLYAVGLLLLAGTTCFVITLIQADQDNLAAIRGRNVSDLIRLLDDERFAWRAAQALLDARDPATTGKLAGLLGRTYRLPDATRRAATEVLLKLRDPTAIDCLAEELKDCDLPAFNDIVETMLQLDRTKTITIMRAKLRSWWKGPVAARALRIAGWVPASSEEATFLAIGERNFSELNRRSKEVNTALLRELRSGDIVRIKFAVRAYDGCVGRQQLWNVIGPPLVDLLDSKAATTQAVWVIIELGDESALPYLRNALEKHGDERMAEWYLNSGNPELRNAGGNWALRHRYTVEKTRDGRGGPGWGTGFR